MVRKRSSNKTQANDRRIRHARATYTRCEWKIACWLCEVRIRKREFAEALRTGIAKGMRESANNGRAGINQRESRLRSACNPGSAWKPLKTERLRIDGLARIKKGSYKNKQDRKSVV